jgi:predicted transglutaminase-like cysteine proteinase
MKARWIENQYRNRKLMKLSKSLIIAALVAGSLFTGSALLQAQPTTNTPPAGAPPGGPRGPGMRGGGPTLDVIATTLKLDDATKAKVKTILDARDQKLKDLMASSPSPEDRRTKMQAIRDDVNTQMKAVLTADQYAQWEKMNQPRQRRAAPVAAPAAAPAAAPVTAPQK